MSHTSPLTASLRRLATAVAVPAALIGSALAVAPAAHADVRVATTSSLQGPATLAPGQSGSFYDTVAPASPGGPLPTGTITFVEVDINTGATTVLGNVPLSASGDAILVSPLVGYGTFGVHAHYRGDATYQDSWSDWVYPEVVTPEVTSVAIGPNPLDFGDQAVDSTTTRTVTVTNTGTTSVNGIELFAVHGQVPISSQICQILAPGDSCTATVAFTPTTAGPVTDTILLSGHFDTQAIVVTGAGVAVDSTALTITPNPVAFGNQAVGSVSTRTVTLTNTASIPWTVGAIGLTSDAVTWASLPCTTLAPGASCTATVRFAPTAAGPVSATLGLGSNFGTSWITVTGTGVAPAPAPAPVITRISPAKGSHNGGTLVTITGRNFTGVTAIRIGGVLMRSVSCSSSTTCTAITPRGTGTKAIRVTAGGRTSALAAADRFTYL
jgi:hypothetical protein